jgi:hypothetical protein
MATPENVARTIYFVLSLSPEPRRRESNLRPTHMMDTSLGRVALLGHGYHAPLQHANVAMQVYGEHPIFCVGVHAANL